MDYCSRLAGNELSFIFSFFSILISSALKRQRVCVKSITGAECAIHKSQYYMRFDNADPISKWSVYLINLPIYVLTHTHN